MKAKQIEVEVSKIKPNPFKKFINKGKLEEETINKLVEGFKQTTFHENLAGRFNQKGEVELIYGHHRLEAVKRHYGKNFDKKLKKEIVILNEEIKTVRKESQEEIDKIKENTVQPVTQKAP